MPQSEVESVDVDSMDVDTVTPVTPKIEKGDKMETEEVGVKEDESKEGKKTDEGEKKEAEAPEAKKKEKEKVGYDISNMSGTDNRRRDVFTNMRFIDAIVTHR